MNIIIYITKKAGLNMKNIYKCLVFIIIFSGAYIFGAFGGAISCMSQNRHDKKIPLTIIMYHNITKKPALTGKYAVSTAEFESDLKYLKNNGYSPVSMKEVTDFAYNGTPLPEKPVVITFDDGYESFYAYAYPLLEKYGFKAVVNVVGSFAEHYTEIEAEGNKDAHNLDYSYLNYRELRELAESGIVEIGNHTYDMHTVKGRKGCSKKSGESSESYAAALNDDIARSQEIFEKAAGVRPYIFAYPYGAFSEETPEIIRKNGFKAVFSCTEKINHISAGNIDWLFWLCRYNRPGGMSSESFFAKME